MTNADVVAVAKAGRTAEPEPVLSASGLVKSFPLRRNLLGRVTERLHAVDGVDLAVAPGRTLGVVGAAAGLLVRLDQRPENFQFASRATFFYVVLACVAATLALTAWIVNARFGAQLAAVRENEEAARALGIDTFAVKLRAMTLSAAITAAFTSACNGFMIADVMPLEIAIERNVPVTR